MWINFPCVQFYIMKTLNFTCLKRVKSRLADRLSESLTADAEQRHPAALIYGPE